MRWPWQSRAPVFAKGSEEAITRCLFNTGWHDWMGCHPPHGCLIELYRVGWPNPVIATREECGPEMNIANLYWRLTGIGKEQLEAKIKQRGGSIQWQSANIAGTSYEAEYQWWIGKLIGNSKP